MKNFTQIMGTLFGSIGHIPTPYQSLYGLKTNNLSEATNFHIRAFHLPTSCHMMQFKSIKRLILLSHQKLNCLKGQLQRFHKLSLFDRFRHVENGFDVNF